MFQEIVDRLLIIYLTVGDYGNLIIQFYMRWIMLKLLKKLLKKTKEQYAGLVYDRSTLSEIDDLVIHFTINDQLFLKKKKIMAFLSLQPTAFVI
jgi:hypothetical protein